MYYVYLQTCNPVVESFDITNVFSTKFTSWKEKKLEVDSKKGYNCVTLIFKTDFYELH
jgi:hypothetical protein